MVLTLRKLVLWSCPLFWYWAAFCWLVGQAKAHNRAAIDAQTVHNCRECQKSNISDLHCVQEGVDKG